MEKYGLFGKLVAIEGKGAELLDILLESSKLMKLRNDCAEYSVSVDLNDENIIWVYEIWDSKEAHDQSLQDPNVRNLISNAIPILAESPQKGIETKVFSL